jgi:hypothetical protein
VLVTLFGKLHLASRGRGSPSTWIGEGCPVESNLPLILLIPEIPLARAKVLIYMEKQYLKRKLF